MALKFSDEQLKAIDTVGHNILVSAGAGSGKTAVLTERITRLVEKGTPITRFLVLTFTDAAAMSMKSKIRSSLLANEKLAHLAPDIENAHIETFDAFCLFLVSKFATVLKISPDINVIDQTILQIEEDRIIARVFKEWCEKNDPVFNEMYSTFSIKNGGHLQKLVKGIIHLANLQLDKEDFFANFEQNYLSDSLIESCISSTFKDTYKKVEALKEASYELSTQKEVDYYVDYFSSILKANDYDELRNNIIAKKSEQKMAIKSCDVKEFVKSELDGLLSTDYGDSQFIISTFKNNRKFIRLLVDISADIDNRLRFFQYDHNAFSFSDIAKMAISLVRNENICKEVSESFDYILVDEYQDTSDIQEEVITKLSRNNLYMVGDVKQSIYRFRNANCNIFNNKYLAYKENNGGETINMNRSFRSREQIVFAINDIFSQLMTKNNNIIDYSNGHNYEYGAKGYSTLIDKDGNYNVDLVSYDLDEDESAFDREMKIITSDIIRKINSGYKVVDNGSMRPCTYNDFAIIIDRKTRFDDIRRFFTEKNIPINAIQDESLKEHEITYITKNLIKMFSCIKNNQYDNEFKHAYCSIARSFLISKPDREIYKEIKFNDLSKVEISLKIKVVIDKYSTSSLYEILNGLYEEFDVFSKLSLIGDISSGIHKCDVYLGYASNMDSLGYTLEDMFSFFDDLTNSDNDISFADSSNSDDAVTLINIHKSKGLEYKIVYMPFLNVKFNRQQQKSSFIADQKYGINLPIVGRNAYDSLLLHLIKERDIKEDFEEKLRLFYVALTRAREKLVLITNNKALSKEGFNIKKASSFAEILSYIDYGKYLTEYPVTDETIMLKKDDLKPAQIELAECHVDSKEITRKKASKEKTLDADEAALDFGTRIHYALELLDYKTKDLSYIKDVTIKKYVENVVTSFVFEDIENATILNEYKFNDAASGVNGIIDCLIIREDEIDIVDFKLKNISDVHYDEQLHIYEDYVKKISTLPIKLYLVSAITGEVREVE